MKNTPLLLFISLPTFAADISGAWELDKEKTEEFNSKYSVQEQLEKVLFACSNEVIEFHNGTFQASATDYPCSYQDKNTIVKGHNLKAKYKIVGKTSNSVVIEFVSQDKTKTYGQYHFINPDLVWLYVGDSGELESSNVRRYYRKQK